MREAATIVKTETAQIGALPVYRVRAAASGYLTIGFFLIYAAAFLWHYELGLSAICLLGATGAILPLTYFFDGIEFDGKSLRRTGFFGALRRINGGSRKLKIADIAVVETQFTRILSVGGRAFLLYRTEISGDGQTFALTSGSKNYNSLVRHLFALLPDEKLDLPSLELRDYSLEPAELKQKIAAAQLPSDEVLANTLPRLRHKLPRETGENQDPANQQKADEWRALANQLRVAGRFAQAAEASRRALRMQPDNPAALLHELARGLYFQGVASRRIELARRAEAALRLSFKRAAAQNDHELLTRIGESCYLVFDRPARAAKAFQAALEIAPENFRAECGLADIALHDGKIAHVVHRFQAAARQAANQPALQRWAQAEADYFALLNQDEDYMDAELFRVNLLDYALTGRQTVLYLVLIGIAVIPAGWFINPIITEIGWTTAAVALLIWTGLALTEMILNNRLAADEEAE